MRTPALLLVGLLAATALPTTASAAGCDNPPLPWQDFRCDAQVPGALDVVVQYRPNDGHPFNDYVEVCFQDGDPTGGLIGDCRGALLPTLA